jgi:hypothetical protein
MPRGINSETRRRQRRVASALRRDHSATAQVQVPLAPDARVLVDDAVFGDGGGRCLGVGVRVAAAVVPVVAAGVAVVLVAVFAAGVGVGGVGGGGAEFSGPVGAADVQGGAGDEVFGFGAGEEAA